MSLEVQRTSRRVQGRRTVGRARGEMDSGRPSAMGVAVFAPVHRLASTQCTETWVLLVGFALRCRSAKAALGPCAQAGVMQQAWHDRRAAVVQVKQFTQLLGALGWPVSGSRAKRRNCGSMRVGASGRHEGTARLQAPLRGPAWLTAATSCTRQVAHPAGVGCRPSEKWVVDLGSRSDPQVEKVHCRHRAATRLRSVSAHGLCWEKSKHG